MRNANSLNTPKPGQIKDLYEKTLGINDITLSWRWEGLSNETAKDWIKRMVELRGAVAHGRKPDVNLGSFVIMFLRDLAMECAVATHNDLTENLLGVTGRSPWPHAVSVHDFEYYAPIVKGLPEAKEVLLFFKSGEIHYALAQKE